MIGDNMKNNLYLGILLLSCVAQAMEKNSAPAPSEAKASPVASGGLTITLPLAFLVGAEKAEELMELARINEEARVAKLKAAAKKKDLEEDWQLVEKK
jgi:hypothetical protein